MSPDIVNELREDTKLEDISERYREIAILIGIESFMKLADYAKGDEIYFPKMESVLIPARNRKIREEYNGWNRKELAQKYDLTPMQIGYILKGVPVPGQTDIFSLGEAMGIEI